MSAKDELDRLERYGGLFTIAAVRQLVEELLAVGGPEWGDTACVAKFVGMSTDYWQDRARAGEIPGAFQRTVGGPWVLPLEACRAHLRGESLRKANAPKSTRRKPWRQAS